MAQFTIVITDMGPNSLDVHADSNPPLPSNAILCSNAQMVGIELVKQLQTMSKQVNTTKEHKAQMDNLSETHSLTGLVKS